MGKRYYTLAIRENGRWGPQFGDLQRSVVNQERIDSYASVRGRDWEIFSTDHDAGQPAVDEAIRELNESAR